MTKDLMNLVWEQFVVEREKYLALKREWDQVQTERDKMFNRLTLLKKLLELEGREVVLPERVKR
jgi:hypothetical protein